MIYCVLAQGNPKGLAKYLELKERFIAKYPDASLFHYDAETIDTGDLYERAAEDSLFGGAYLVLCYRVSEHKEYKSTLYDLVPTLASSPNHFLLYEENLDAKTAALIAKEGTLYTISAQRKKVSYNPFDLSGALASRDRRAAWVELQRARRSGLSDEDLLRPLIWQVKAMLLASMVPLGESGLKPSVYERSRRAATRYTHQELLDLSLSLATLQPLVVAGKVELESALESLVLNL